MMDDALGEAEAFLAPITSKGRYMHGRSNSTDVADESSKQVDQVRLSLSSTTYQVNRLAIHHPLLNAGTVRFSGRLSSRKH